MAPGLLYVTMQPNSSLPAAQFHDWYNNEHGPTRLRLPFCTNGFRYHATDLSSGSGTGTPEQPEWLAIYDMSDMDELNGEQYTRLRLPEVKSQREKDTMAQIKVDRKLYDMVSERKGEGFVDLASVKEEENEKASVLVSVIQTLHPGKKADFDKWYEEEHIPLLSKIPGWLRSRRYITSSIADPKSEEELEYLATHEYAPQNGLGGAEFKAAISTSWYEKIMSESVKSKTRRVYEHYYTFGPAPRDLASLVSPDALPSFTSPDGSTRSFSTSSSSSSSSPSTSPSSPSIESYITTPDGATLPYRLEGSPDPTAPLVILINSVLVDYTIWDAFVRAFLSNPTTKHHRILRYNARGRTASFGSTTPITVALLAHDVVCLLDALRIPQAACVLGVSLGGATALCAALSFPQRVRSFVACDTNAFAPPGNPKAWGERIAVAEKEGARDSDSGRAIVGQELAEMTVRRWFVGESFDGGAMEREAQRVKEMVSRNDLEGFKRGVRALFEYDFREAMGGAEVKGAFVAGGGDGVLPKTMGEMAKSYGAERKGGGVELKVVEGAGHLPMVEKPEEVADFVGAFLRG